MKALPRVWTRRAERHTALLQWGGSGGGSSCSPRFVVHFIPTSSLWLYLVERWVAELTSKQSRRRAHHSARALNADIRAWIDTWKDNLLPFVWTRTADEILDSIAR